MLAVIILGFIALFVLVKAVPGATSPSPTRDPDFANTAGCLLMLGALALGVAAFYFTSTGGF